MRRAKSSISEAHSYREIGEFRDTHDLGDVWERTKPAHFDVDIEAEVTLYALDRDLTAQVDEIARERGISAETLVNLWIQEKVREHTAQPASP